MVPDRLYVGGVFGGFGFLLAQDGFAAQADLVAFDVDHLYQHLIAFLQLVVDVLDAVLGDFADVQQAVGAGEDFDERAEFLNANHLAPVNPSDFDFGGDTLDVLDRALGPSAIALGECEGLQAHARSVGIRLNLG